ncbi:DDE_3 domain-containing protein [Trichonephila clavipes]|nr:DDE_3 domain-containing protein [Trichonephila clavipes]
MCCHLLFNSLVTTEEPLAEVFIGTTDLLAIQACLRPVLPNFSSQWTGQRLILLPRQKTSSDYNEGFKSVYEVLPQIHFREYSTELRSHLNLEVLIHHEWTSFYHYMGSLTVPACDEEDQGGACKQSFCDQDTVNLHLESWSVQQLSMKKKMHSYGYSTAAGLYLNLVIQSVALPFVINTYGDVIQQDNLRPYTIGLTQHPLQIIHMLPSPARFLNPSSTECKWSIGRQLKSHPHPALTIPLLADL